jgi:hypothetical protein
VMSSIIGLFSTHSNHISNYMLIVEQLQHRTATLSRPLEYTKNPEIKCGMNELEKIINSRRICNVEDHSSLDNVRTHDLPLGKIFNYKDEHKKNIMIKLRQRAYEFYKVKTNLIVFYHTVFVASLSHLLLYK